MNILRFYLSISLLGFGVTGFAPEAEIGFVRWRTENLAELIPHLRAGDIIQIGLGYHTEGAWVTDPERRGKLNVEWLEGVQDMFRYLTEEVGVHIVASGKSLIFRAQDINSIP